MKIEKVQ